MSDIMSQKTPFKYKTPPYQHQRDELKSSVSKEAWGILWEMGTGKTKLIIDNIAYLFLHKAIDSCLIIAPKGVYLNWAYVEIDKHMSDNVTYFTAHWSSQLRQSDKVALAGCLTPEPGVLDILCMNSEAFSSKKGGIVARAFLKRHKGTFVCIDESTCIKNPKANRTKEILSLRPLSKYRRILTGSPVTQSPLDLYSQFDFLRPGSLGFTSYFQFKNYFTEVTVVHLGSRSFTKISGYRNLNELKQRLTTVSSRVTKEDCLDLPEKIFQTVCVDMSPEQWKIYEQIRDQAYADLAKEEAERGEVSVTSALTAVSKLQQVTCGHIKNDAGDTVVLDNGRISALLEQVESSGEQKIIIWCHFRQCVLSVSNALRKEYGDASTVEYYGSTANEERPIAVNKFMTDPTVRFFVASSAASRGLTLVASNFNIYYSQGYNLEVFTQSQDRTHRIGQTRAVTYQLFMVPNTVDEKVIKALQSKKELADSIMSAWREMLMP